MRISDWSSDVCSSDLDRSDASGFDLKQGEGGLVDLEFALQYLVLRDGAQSPSLLRPRDTPGLIDACAEAGVFDEDIANALREAHGVLLAAGLECTLDRRRRWVVENEAVRSEEHTSELQSLMRISYAVFCL